MISDYVAHCLRDYSIPGDAKDAPDLVSFGRGPGGLPVVVLSHPNGARAEVCLHGAAVTIWRRADGSEMLFLRGDNAFDGADPVRGGVGLAWPQLGVGALPAMGLLRTLRWSVVETHRDSAAAPDPCPTVSLLAQSDAATLAEWPHPFEALYTVSLLEPDLGFVDPRKALTALDEANAAALRAEARAARLALGDPAAAAEAREEEEAAAREAAPAAAPTGGGWRRTPLPLVPAGGEAGGGGGGDEAPPVPPSQLRVTLQVFNAGADEMRFTAGVLPHFATQDIATHSKFVQTMGLNGKYVLDYSANAVTPTLRVESEHVQFFDPAGATPVDRLYVDCLEGGQVLFCPGTRHHFDVRNVEGFCDIEVLNPGGAAPDVARCCVVVAPAKRATAARLAPGEDWCGTACITAHSDYWPLPPWQDPNTVPVPPAFTAVPPRRTARSGDAIYDDPLA
jgi:glucose-6-phosphate 1-epimerase